MAWCSERINVSNSHDEMKLPEGKTCAQCAHFSKCSQLVGAKADWTSCDFHPSRYLLNAREIALSALLKAKETIKALYGDVAWDIFDKNSREMKQINGAIKDLRP
jgi:hypothetical protein